MNESKKRGGLRKYGTKDGIEYRQTYFLNSTDKTSYEAVLVYKMPGNTSPFDLSASIFVLDYTFTPLGDHWILEVNFADTERIEEDENGSSYSFGADDKVKKFELANITYDPNWWGIGIVNAALELPDLRNVRRYLESTGTKTDAAKAARANVIECGYYDINNRPVREGSYIYMNASVDDVNNPLANPSLSVPTTYSVGTPDFTDCPFKKYNGGAVTITELPAKMVGVVGKTIQYEMQYGVRSDTTAIEDVGQFIGTNGSWGSGFTPTITAWTKTALWKAEYCNVEWDYVSKDGKKYHRITRRALKAPNPNSPSYTSEALIWDVSKRDQTAWVW